MIVLYGWFVWLALNCLWVLVLCGTVSFGGLLWTDDAVWMGVWVALECCVLTAVGWVVLYAVVILIWLFMFGLIFDVWFVLIEWMICWYWLYCVADGDCLLDLCCLDVFVW